MVVLYLCAPRFKPALDSVNPILHSLDCPILQVNPGMQCLITSHRRIAASFFYEINLLTHELIQIRNAACYKAIQIIKM